MRWFDREGFCGSFGDAQAEAVKAAYWRHIEELRPHLPDAVRRLALEVNLHDARITEWEIREGVLLAGFGWGDLQVGYWGSTLTYAGAQVRVDDPQCLDDPETEILYDEVDTTESGSFEHRLLLTPQGEVAIRFDSLELKTEPLKQRAESHARAQEPETDVPA